LPVPEAHRAGKGCPAQPPVSPGTLAARLVGRALGKDKKPLANTLRQENYVEDRIQVPFDMQARLARAFAAAGNARFRIGDDLARLVVGHAYLGQIDVNPLGSPAGGSGEFQQCEFWGQKVVVEGAPAIHVEGQSRVSGGESAFPGRIGDGRGWRHDVQLSWDGSIELQGNRIARLLLLADGTEKLNWGNQFRQALEGADVTHLPGGHAIDIECAVKYGVIGEASAEDLRAPAEAAAQAPPEGLQVPDEARKQITEALGPPLLVFHPKVQIELKVKDDQKQKLDERLMEQIQEAMQFFQRLEGTKPEERGKELEQFRRKVHDAMSGFLQKTLEPDQLKRFRQIMLQQEGAFVLLNDEISKELEIKDEQRRQLMSLVQELQRKVEPLVQEAQTKGNPQEIRPKVLQLREDYGRKLEAVLTETQKKQWKELLGKPLDLGE
ncbi:MAG TPA: hypothetical protein VGY53_11225, partial [Isosphaeraceae bacterium]|nr:hypothetical protein [Isosphaeraceae bacterium]